MTPLIMRFVSQQGARTELESQTKVDGSYELQELAASIEVNVGVIL